MLKSPGQQQEPELQCNNFIVIDTCLKRSILWQHFQQIKLMQNMRKSQGEQEFSKWLLEL